MSYKDKVMEAFRDLRDPDNKEDLHPDLLKYFKEMIRLANAKEELPMYEAHIDDSYNTCGNCDISTKYQLNLPMYKDWFCLKCARKLHSDLGDFLS